MNEPNMDIIGWREWVRIPELGIKRIQAKIDTGARSSCLHAGQIQIFTREGIDWVRFQIHPRQKNDQFAIDAVARLMEFRQVRSSNGQLTRRPVIRVPIRLMQQTFAIDLSLIDRHKMEYRMLVGREALQGRFLVDASRSFVGGKPRKKRSRRTDNET